jgi:hypothetical protein
MTCDACNRAPDEPCFYLDGCPHNDRDAKLARAQAIAAEARPRVQERKDRLADNGIVHAALLREQNAIAARAVLGYYLKYIRPNQRMRAVAGRAAA